METAWMVGFLVQIFNFIFGPLLFEPGFKPYLKGQTPTLHVVPATCLDKIEELHYEQYSA